MTESSSFVQQIFGDKNFYEIFEVEKSASEDEIKKAYRKLALRYHPDRVGGDTEKFKALSIVYSTLSDSTKRTLYDNTGEIDAEDEGEDFKNWYEYFRTLFPKLTVGKLEEFSASYKGSEEERGDLIEAYKRFDGDMEKVMSVVILAEKGEEERLCCTIDSIISFGDLESTPIYEKFKLKAKSAVANFKKSKGKRVKKGESSESDLAALILSNSSSRGNAFANVMAKYGCTEKDEFEDISDEAFKKTQDKILKKKVNNKKI
jgi:DnaJ family protein C protein 9